MSDDSDHLLRAEILIVDDNAANVRVLEKMLLGGFLLLGRGWGGFPFPGLEPPYQEESP